MFRLAALRIPDVPVRFAGSCSSVPEGYQFRVGSLELGPFTVSDLTQHPTYCEADLMPTHMQGYWHSITEPDSDLSNVQTYPVTITVPEPSVSLSLIVGYAALLFMRKWKFNEAR